MSTQGFSPSRLRVARQLAGLKQVELAREVELTPPALSQYENGLHVPGVHVVTRLALCLGFPRDFFFADESAPAPSPAFFRSLRSTPQNERDRAAAFSWVVARVTDELETHVRLPRCDLRLEIDVPLAPRRADIEAAAAAAREAWKVPSGPVANIVRLLEAHGAVVAVFNQGDSRLSAFSQWHGPRPVVVFCMGKYDKARQRYDAAHELAHLALHAEPQAGNHVLEQQADEFASALLMPADEIEAFLPRGPVDWEQLANLKRTWGVSMQALLVRAHRLGTLRDRHYQSAFRHLSRAGWRRNEPVDLGPPEQPELLSRAFGLLRGKGGDPFELLTTLALPDSLIMQLVGESAASATTEANVFHLTGHPVVPSPARSGTS